MKAYLKVCEQAAAKPVRWVVTGAAGFIGSALVETLLELDQHVVGVDNFVTGHRENVEDVLAVIGPERAARFQLIEGDVADAGVCREACTGARYLLHQAALGSVPRSLADPLATHHNNVNGFLQIMLAARDAGMARVVYASSSSVYGDHPGLPKVEDRIGRALSPYAVTKRIDELYAGVLEDCYGLPIVGLRYFNVFGRRQDPDGPYAAVIPRWIGALIEDRRCEIFGDGNQSRDFCYIDNVVQANILAATAAGDVTNRVYNVGCRGRTDLNELFRMIRDALAVHVPRVKDAEAVHGDPRPGDVVHSQANIDAICAALGYEPSHAVQEGMTETVAWFARRHGAAAS